MPFSLGIVSRRPRILPILPAAALLVTAAWAGPPETPAGAPPRYEARPLTGIVHIDGVLDDAAWQGPGNEGLIQNEPTNGAPPVQRTVWWIAYDRDAIYAAFRLYDSAPDSIDTSVARRDADLNTDMVILELDPYNDDRNGYVFLVGAGGYVYDSSMYNDGWEDPSWDGIWESAARVDSLGWTAEMKIPLNQIRFPNRDDQVWGVNVSRRVKRIHGRDDLFLRPRNESGHVSRFADLGGIRGIRNRADRELVLYGLGKGEYLQHPSGDPFNDGSAYKYQAGGDVKLGLTSDLNLNATLNPDFGQVEVDPAVVNLSAYETYFDEKRPFFVEDNSIFGFANGGTSSNWGFNWGDPELFYSRRIGRNPQLYPMGSPRFTDTPDGTTILGAAKVTGKVDGAQVGALAALTDRENFRLSDGNREWKQLAEPRTGYGALRINRDARDRRSGLGAMVTGVHRDLSDSLSRATLPRNAVSGGVDAWTKFGAHDSWAVKAYLAGSLVEGDPNAMAAEQTNSRRYYQRPDASHLNYDPSRTSLSGWISRVLLNREKGNLMLNAGLAAASPGFEINDMGFNFRSDLVNTHVVAGRKWTEPGRLFRDAWVAMATYWTWDFGGTRNGGGLGPFFAADFANYWSMDGHLFFNPRYDDTRSTRGGPVMRAPVNREIALNVSTDSRRAYQINWSGFAATDGAGGDDWNAGVSLSVQPTPALKVSLGPNYNRNHATYQYVTTRTDAAAVTTYGHRYLFADLVYRELSMSTRVDWAFTPRLTLQTYIQPLLAVGEYTGIKEFSEPGGLAFRQYGKDGGSSIVQDPSSGEYTIDPGDGGAPFTLGNPDFNFKSLRMNLVLRWEYRPGSTFYLAWTRNGVDTGHPGDLAFRRDLDALFSAPTDNVLLVKATRWLDF
jgi:Domain of unknown function (DUF5916)